MAWRLDWRKNFTHPMHLDLKGQRVLLSMIDGWCSRLTWTYVVHLRNVLLRGSWVGNGNEHGSAGTGALGLLALG